MSSSKQVSHPKHARSKVLAPREDRMPKNDRGWGGAGAVGWGVLGAFGSMEKDTGAQVVRRAGQANANFKMVKDEKGLWVKVKVDAPAGGGRGRGGGIPAMGEEGEAVFGRLQEQGQEEAGYEGYGGREDDRGDDRGRRRRRYDSSEDEEDDRDRRKGRRHSRSRSWSRGRGDRDRDRRRRSRSGSRGRKRGYSRSNSRDRHRRRRSRSSSRDRDRRRRSRSDSRGRDRRRRSPSSDGGRRRRDDGDETERRGGGGRQEQEQRQEREAAAPPAAREEAAAARTAPPPNPEEMSFTAAQLADRLVEVYNTSSPRRYDNIAACFQPDVSLCVLKTGNPVIKGVERLRDSMPSDFSRREATCTRRLLILPDDPADPSFALDFYPAGHAPGMQAFGKGDTPLDTILLFQAAPGPKNRIAHVWIAPDAKGLATAEKVSELDILSSKAFAQAAAVVKERVKGGGTSQHFHDYQNMETIG